MQRLYVKGQSLAIGPLRAIEVALIGFVFGGVAAQDVGQVLRKCGTRHHHVAAGFLGLHLQIALNVRDEADDGCGLLELRAHFGNDRQRLDAVAVQVNHDQRGLFFRVLAGLFRDLFFRLHELDLHVELARHFLNLGQEKEVVNEGVDAGRRVFTLVQRLHVWDRSCAVTEAVTLRAGAVLVAVTVVHGADESASAATLASAAILAVGAVLAASVALLARALPLALALALPMGLIGIVVGMSAETAFTTPLMPVSRVVRLLWCFIHTVITCEFWSVLPEILLWK